LSDSIRSFLDSCL